MHWFLRSLLFAFFVALFVIGAPAVVLYTAGYRLNPQNGHIVRTGVLSVSSTPRGATVTWNNNDTSVTTPYVYNRVMPGTYTITIQKDGYHPLVREVHVESGKTTYLNNLSLFPKDTPELLAEESATAFAVNNDGSALAVLRRAKNSTEVWRYTVANTTFTLEGQIAVAEEVPLRVQWTSEQRIVVNDGTATVFVSTASRESRVTLHDNSQAIEVYADNALAALLPSSTYTVAEVDWPYAVITDTRNNLYFFNFASSDPILLSTNATSYDWNRTLGKLTWIESGIELRSFDAASRATSFITRQSTPIIDAAWYASGNAMLAATSSRLAVITFDDGIPQGAYTLVEMDIEKFWTDADGRYAYLFGTLNTVHGLYRLRLK